jgi:PTS system mannose-specific IID component
VVSSFLRSFTVQGSWNYRTLIGSGFAFALLPILRELGGKPDEVEARLRRHVDLFNAHPYLSPVALGAVTRLEADGEDAAVVERFKMAIRGPLGGLGDALVWAAWLPATLLGVLALALAGAGPVLCLVTFLLIYNAGHVGLRIWGFRVGLENGKQVGPRLRTAGLGPLASRISAWGAVLVGAVAGLLLTGDHGFATPTMLWLAPATLAFLLGLRAGQSAWRPTALATVVAVGLLLVLPLLLA